MDRVKSLRFVAQMTFEGIIHTAYKDGNTTESHLLTWTIRLRPRESVGPAVLDKLSRAIEVEGNILQMSAKRDAYPNALFLVRNQ